jgi:dihydroorotase
MNEGELSGILGLTGWPAVAEEAIIARDVLLASHVDSRLHVCHVSTSGSVAIIRWAKEMGIRVTAEVTPHHLLLTEDLVASFDPVYKVNPPLRSRADTLALREALADGTLDIVATDHAPHPHESKDCEWDRAAFGMLGLETALGVVVAAMAETPDWSWRTLSERMSIAPAKIGRAVNHGRPLAVGEPAHIVLIDPQRTREVVSTQLASLSGNTPFAGMTLPVTVTDVFFNGVHQVRDGELNE